MEVVTHRGLFLQQYWTISTSHVSTPKTENATKAQASNHDSNMVESLAGPLLAKFYRKQKWHETSLKGAVYHDVQHNGSEKKKHIRLEQDSRKIIIAD